MKKALIVIFSLVLSASHAQTFIPNIIAGVPTIEEGPVAVGDYDNDGDLDFAITGLQAHLFDGNLAYGGVGFTGIYKNTGGSFALVPNLNLLEARLGDVAWGDFDNDKDLDLIVSGHPTGENATNKQVMALYKNNGNDKFEAMPTGIIPFCFGKFELIDFDKDGLLDIGATGVVEGQYGGVGFADVYKNYGNFNFQRMNLPIAQVNCSVMSFFDIENDGDLDLILNGFNPNAGPTFYETYLYINKNNSLTPASGLPNIGAATLGVHDLNNDGYKDVVLMGYNISPPYNATCNIYMNNAGTLQKVESAIPGLLEGTIDFADFDLDNDIDMLISGGTAGITERLTKLVRNDAGVLTVLPDYFEGSFRGGATWGDFDSDGDFDFIKSGYKNTILYSQADNKVHNITATICEGTIYSFNDQLLTEPGIYSKTIHVTSTYDSIVRLNLTVTPAPQIPISATICSGSSYSFGGQLLTSSGIYNWTTKTPQGCDSIVTLTLTVLSTASISTSLSATICSGTSYLFDGDALSSAGEYAKSYPAINGCDSVVTLTLEVLPPLKTSFSATICNGATYLFDGDELSSAGIYTKSYKTSGGCDSLVELTLSLTELNTTIEQEGSHLRAVENNVEYQWFDCDAGKIIEGETGKIFKVLQDGNYSVTIMNGECRSTSECVFAKSIFENYPNPARDIVSFKLGDIAKSIEVRMFNKSGMLVATWTFANLQEFEVTIAEYPDDQYFFQVFADGEIKTSKIVKKGK